MKGPSVRRRDREIDARARAARARARRADRELNQGCLFGLMLMPLWSLGSAVGHIRRLRSSTDGLWRMRNDR